MSNPCLKNISLTDLENALNTTLLELIGGIGFSVKITSFEELSHDFLGKYNKEKYELKLVISHETGESDLYKNLFQKQENENQEKNI